MLTEHIAYNKNINNFPLSLSLSETQCSMISRTYLAKMVGRVARARRPVISLHSSMLQQSRQLIQLGPLLDIAPGERASSPLAARHHFHATGSAWTSACNK